MAGQERRARQLKTAPKGRTVNADCITKRHYAAIVGMWAALWAFICLWGWVA